MNAFRAVAHREIKMLLDRKSLLFLFTAWPLILALLLGGIYTEQVVVKMPVAVIDNDHSMLSRMLIRYVDASRSFHVTYRVQTREEMEQLMVRDKIAAGIYIPREFERSVKRGESPVIPVFISGANYMTANLALADLRYIVGTVSAGVQIKYLRKAGSQRERAFALQSPVKTELAKLYNPGYNYLHFLAPGLWLAVLQQIIMLFGALLIAQELDKKTFGELMRVSGGRILPLVAGKIAPSMAISFLLLATVYLVFFPLFGIPIRGSMLLLLLFSMLFAFATVSLGFLLSAALRNRSDAIKGTLLLAAPAFLLSGYTWPINSMPSYLHLPVYLIPLTVFLEGFRKIYQQGSGITSLFREIAVLSALTATYLAAGTWFVKRCMKESRLHG